MIFSPTPLRLELLASGRPEVVSVNVVAKEAGVTWGTVQYQFRDADGLWAATIDHILATAGPVVWATPSATSTAERVGELIDLAWTALGPAYDTARTTLQSNLVRTRGELAREYPETAKALDAVDKTWAAQIKAFLDDLPADRASIRRVCAFLPTTLRGMHAEYIFGSHLDVEDALAGLREAVTAYLMTTRDSAGGPLAQGRDLRR